jgi:hypothetical protein
MAIVAAEFAGGLIMVAVLTVILRAVMTPQRIAEAKRQADCGLAGRMEGHAAMDMSVSGEGSILARITSPKASPRCPSPPWCGMVESVSVGSSRSCSPT